MVTTRFDALDDNARDLFAASMQWMERYWDEAAGLLRGAGDAALSSPHHTTRGSVWYAFGLLMRQNPGDRARAFRVIDNVLRYQLDAPGRPFHGTFPRAPEEPLPGDDAVIWRDYDPNWREFIITALQLILLEYADQLPGRLVQKIDAGVRRAVIGARARGLSASYTNIALMYAFMLCIAGERFGESTWSAEGERMAREIYQLFILHRAFAEYNSPTYYGVDLYALGLWRSYPGIAPLLAPLGAQMEAALWRDVAQFYHAGLRNLAGPYDRSYGMDLRGYVSLIGMWIRLATDKVNAPFPDTGLAFAHGHDIGFVPLFAFLGPRVPSDALPYLRVFHKERQVERVIADAPRRVATAWLDADRMIGGEFTSRTPARSDQFHPATLHWRIDQDYLGWARLLHADPVDARASRNRLEIATTRAITFLIQAHGAERSCIQRDRWRLPGLSVRVATNADAMHVEPRGGLLDVHYQVVGHQPIDCILQCEKEPL